VIAPCNAYRKNSKPTEGGSVDIPWSVCVLRTTLVKHIQCEMLQYFDSLTFNASSVVFRYLARARAATLNEPRHVEI
jgi:hypothetical protein